MGEKLLVYFETSIKPNAVNVIRRNDICDPGLPFAHDSGILSLQIWKLEMLITCPAFCRLGLIFVIRNLAVRVV